MGADSDGDRPKSSDRGGGASADPPVLHSRGALGLPSGSVRAILTLMTVAFIVVQTARGEKIGLLWFESLMIVLAHYFASRRLVHMSPELRERLTREGVLEAEPNPLYLPRYTLRLVIIGAFLVLALYLWRVGRILDPVAVAILIAVGAYFLGVIFHSVMAWWRRLRRKDKATAHGAATWFDDVRAIVTLAAMSIVVVLHLTGLHVHVPYGDKLEALPLALMLFYFGSR